MGAASPAEKIGETDLPAQQDCSQAPSRVPLPYGDGRGTESHRGPPRPRPQAPVRL